MTYDEWIAQVDRLCQRNYGLSVHDLEDWPSRDAYDAGDSPTDGLRTALDHSDTFQMFSDLF